MIRVGTLLILFLITCVGANAQEGVHDMATANEIIQKMGLQPLPEEGGYYKETYRSEVTLSGQADGQSVGTGIYYMVIPSSFSALHRLINGDEIFHFYGGNPVEMIQIDPSGELRTYTIGSDVLKGEVPQVIVPVNTWQALRLKEGGSWALLGTTVSPGFEFKNFELGTRDNMLNSFPQHRDQVLKFTRAENEATH
jgi:predicted cupin superfamily sugar epimerase